MSDLAIATPTDPRSGNAIVRFFRGFGYLFRGIGFVFSKHPALLKFCLLPLLINLLVFVGAGIALYHYYGDLVALIWARPNNWFFRLFWYLLYIFIFIAVMLIAYVAFFIVQALLSAPFNDVLSERVEQLAYGHEPPPFSAARLAKDLGRTIAHQALKLLVWVAIMVPLFLLNVFVPVIGSALFLIGGSYVTAFFFAYDYLDYAMARRQWSFSTKMATLKEHRALGLGLGGSLMLCLLVPLLGVLCVPFMTVGGTLLFCDLQQVGAFEERPHAP